MSKVSKWIIIASILVFLGKMAAWSLVTAPRMTETGAKCACAKWVKLLSLRTSCSRHVYSSCQSRVICSAPLYLVTKKFLLILWFLRRKFTKPDTCTPWSKSTILRLWGNSITPNQRNLNTIDRKILPGKEKHKGDLKLFNGSDGQSQKFQNIWLDFCRSRVSLEIPCDCYEAVTERFNFEHFISVGKKYISF